MESLDLQGCCGSQTRVPAAIREFMFKPTFYLLEYFRPSVSALISLRDF
jgi:hypothetical protein